MRLAANMQGKAGQVLDHRLWTHTHSKNINLSVSAPRHKCFVSIIVSVFGVNQGHTEVTLWVNTIPSLLTSFRHNRWTKSFVFFKNFIKMKQYKQVQRSSMEV